MPQRVRTDNVEKLCEVFFRVNKVMGNAEIEVLDGETVLAHYKREHLAPGEMEKIALPKMLLEKAAGDELVVSVKEAE